MLYVTTRNNTDTFTVNCALTENRSQNGGLYLPLRHPSFSKDEIAILLRKPFNQCVAEMMNTLLGTHMAAWDVDFSIGRYPVRLEQLGQSTFAAETWHNPDWNYDRLVSNLSFQLCACCTEPSSWVRIAIRIAVLFGIYSQLRSKGVEDADIALISGDFSAPISAWYARKWGLPIRNIICCCNENQLLWDLICYGQMRTDVLSVNTNLPEADVSIPENLERLIFECGGAEEVDHYLDSCRQGKLYCPSDLVLGKLRRNLFVSVVSSQRLEATVSGVSRTHHYTLSLASALAYAGLQDYRAKTGSNHPAIFLSDSKATVL